MATETHCKDTGHVHVFPSSGNGPGLSPGHIVVGLLPTMQCKNLPDYPGWGLLLYPLHAPLRGMHCLPALAQALPDMLEQASANPQGDPVVIAHTVHGDFEPWKVLTAESAHLLAGDIRTVLEGAP